MGKKRYYIAYGSNLSEDQMAQRCPDARIVGKAVLEDWKLVFKIHADIVPCKGSTVPVLIWEISEVDERRLDRYEGFPVYYIKQELPITMTDLRGRHPKKVTAMVYTMTEGRSLKVPMKGYYMVIAEGYERFGFNVHMLEEALKEAAEVMEREIS